MNNILSDAWLRVKTQDNTVRLVSIEEAFKIARNIKDLVVPCFHGYNPTIYKYCVIKLLGTIITAAYFKPENSFFARKPEFGDELRVSGIWTDTVSEYCKKWRDRFNLDDDTHPFLQDAALRSAAEAAYANGDSYIAKINPFAPADNEYVFNMRRAMKAGEKNYLVEYEMDREEFAYVLLYQISIGASPMPAQYSSSSGASATVFVSLIGQNLLETIIMNLPNVSGSAQPTPLAPAKEYDRPIWEYENTDSIGIPDEEIAACPLLMNFYTFKKYYTIFEGDHVAFVYEPTEKKLLGKEKTEREKALIEAHIPHNQSAVKTDKDGKQSYYNYSDDNAWALCIAASKKEPDFQACTLLRSHVGSKYSVEINWRKYNDKKVRMFSLGVVRLSSQIESIIDGERHKVAEHYQGLWKEIKSAVAEAVKSCIDGANESDANRQQIISTLSAYTEKFFFETLLNYPEDAVLMEYIEEAKTIANTRLRSVIKKDPINSVTAIDAMNRKFAKLKRRVLDGTI